MSDGSGDGGDTCGDDGGNGKQAMGVTVAQHIMVVNSAVVAEKYGIESNRINSSAARQ